MDATEFMSTVTTHLLPHLETMEKRMVISVLRCTAEASCSPGMVPELAKVLGPVVYAELKVRGGGRRGGMPMEARLTCCWLVELSTESCPGGGYFAGEYCEGRQCSYE